MSRNSLIFNYGMLLVILLGSCNKKSGNDTTLPTPSQETVDANILAEFFGSNIDLKNLANYANQTVPFYITKRNGTVASNAKATLGRVLFYDKNLSSNNTVSCASCHQQSSAFGDPNLTSTGVNGTTGRHSMRLINTAFSAETRFFWDERATSLENQTTKPIQDHKEMGYSGQDGDQNLNDLLTKLKAISYYQVLFKSAYGDTDITEARLQESLASFIRSIQSFDSKYDAGRINAPNDGAPFANFTALENQGKNLFLAPPQLDANGMRIGGGAGCGGCHRAPEFDIIPNSGNNGVIGIIGGGTDYTVTRSPSIRDVVKVDGSSNGAFMHNGFTNQLLGVVNHYNQIPIASVTGNSNLDPKLRPQGNPQNLQLTTTEKDALVAFMQTLSGTNVYTDKKWSNPFIK
jgi:cytochrome c peroxidase